MQFNNRDNEEIVLPDGRKIWLSRSCAVTSIVIIEVARPLRKKKYFLLTGVRGKNTPDFQGYRSCPCGYLDWDESLKGAAVRETWEETDFWLPVAWNPTVNYPLAPQDPESEKVPMKVVYDEYTSGQPFHVSSNPDANRQNVTGSFGIVLQVKSLKHLPEISGINVNRPEDDYEEVASADWIPMEEVVQGKHEFAFNHDNRALSFFNRYKQKKMGFLTPW